MKSEVTPPMTSLDYELPLETQNLSDFVFIQDVVYYEGPLLVHYQDRNGLDYFYHWLDGDSQFNRWALYAVESGLAEQFIADVSIRPSVMLSIHPNLFIIDINDQGAICKVYLYNKENFPKEYLN